MGKFKRLLRIAERHTVRPASTRKQPPRSPGVFESIEGSVLGGVVGGRVVATGATDPSTLQGLQGLSAAVESVGKTLAGKSQQDAQQGMQMLGKLMEQGRDPGPSKR